MNKTKQSKASLLEILDNTEEFLVNDHDCNAELELLLHDFDDNYYGEGFIMIGNRELTIESIWTDERHGLIVHVNSDGIEADVYFASLLTQNQKCVIEMLRKRVEQMPDPSVQPTGMLKQYVDLKAKHPDAILLFRCGDFYETYMKDAEDAAKILGITLTKSSKRMDTNGKPLAMAGFPSHALDTYLPKLIRAGRRVSICDQI